MIFSMAFYFIFNYILIIFISIDKYNYKNMGNNHLSDILTSINDYKSTVTLSSVLKHFNYHPNYLSSLIKKYTNKSFSDILQELRLVIIL